MNLFSYGLCDGISLDLAENETRISGFWSGFSLNEVKIANPIGGRHIDIALKNLIQQRGIRMHSSMHNNDLIR